MKTLCVKNMTEAQDSWLRERARKFGNTKSGIIKMMIQNKIEEEKKDRHEMQKM